MQRENFKPKEDKAKHGLMIRAKYLICGFEVLGFMVEEKRRSLALVQSIICKKKGGKGS